MEKTTGTARYEVRGKVALITLDNPPVNGMSHPVRAAMLEGLDRALADPKVEAIVLTGAGKQFSGGADIREFNTPKMLAEPSLRTLIAAFESSAKPVIAALHGTAFGGGLELPLGCHFRVAAPKTQIALPEVKIGLLPGAGGTQRLPRAVGLELALNMIVSGNPVASEELAKAGLVDEIITGDLTEGAVAFANKVVAEKRPLAKLRDRKVKHDNPEAFLAFAKNSVKAVAKNLPAPLKCIEAVAASIDKPFDEGVRIERELFVDLMMGPESRALRHAFFGERAASKIADVPEDTPRRNVARVGVIGAGTMGGGIAMNFLNAGLPVTILETKQEALDRGLATIRKNYENTVRKGRLTQEQLEKRMALITPALDLSALADVDLVIEAVYEDMAIKKDIFGKLDKIAKPGAILATNTSFLDVNEIAASTSRPGDVLGMHFFSPANVMRLLEMVRGEKTSKDVLASILGLAKTLGKVPVVAGVCHGFIANRAMSGRRADTLLLEGATPEQVDKAVYDFGFAMGPFRMSDLAGLDIVARNRSDGIEADLVKLGRLGQKSNAGYYDYDEKRNATPSAVAAKVIADYAAAKGVTPGAPPSAEEIIFRMLCPVVNEGAKILEEGVAIRASDIDVALILGYGWPVYTGGPMFWADTVGLPKIIERLKGLGIEPAKLLVEKAAAGERLTG